MIDNESFKIPDELNPESILPFKNYLEKYKPYEKLEDLEESANDLRTAIISNFSISDILIEVRDQRLSHVED